MTNINSYMISDQSVMVVMISIIQEETYSKSISMLEIMIAIQIF